MPRKQVFMTYLKGVLSVVAAIVIAESAFWWPFLGPSRAIGLKAILPMLMGSLVSPRFWIAGLLSFGLFFAASRANTTLRVLFFWIPTVAVSTLGLAVVGLYTWLYFYLVSRNPQIH